MYCTCVFGRVVRVPPGEDHIAVPVLPHLEALPGWKRRCGLPRLAAKNIACTMFNDWDLEFAAPGKKQMICRRRTVQRGNAALRGRSPSMTTTTTTLYWKCRGIYHDAKETVNHPLAAMRCRYRRKSNCLNQRLTSMRMTAYSIL